MTGRVRLRHTPTEPDHICICVPTYKRPSELLRLLRALQTLATDGLFTYSVLVVDNDPTARQTPPWLTKLSPNPRVDYVNSPIRGVAHARNTAIEHADGDYVAFIDDDEVPERDWLVSLYLCLARFKADGVLGPVLPSFDVAPPRWILAAGVFERPSYPTGTLLRWDMTRTGNVLLRRTVFSSGLRFDPSFSHSEDRDFFRRAIGSGYAFVWCTEATVYEKETPERFTRRYHLHRAVTRGQAAMRHHQFSRRRIATSTFALLAYSALLPALAVAGHSRFMTYAIKICDHAGGLFAALRASGLSSRARVGCLSTRTGR